MSIFKIPTYCELIGEDETKRTKTKKSYALKNIFLQRITLNNLIVLPSPGHKILKPNSFTRSMNSFICINPKITNLLRAQGF